jgi:primosomal protein N' (replication factor Y) (superfamily II helicase)
VDAKTKGVDLSRASVVVGTEAALHRLPRAKAVAFLDFDQELLAPRFRAEEEALALLARGSALVGGRFRGGQVLVQTAVADHEVLAAALHADPGRLSKEESRRRKDLALPPFSAMAVVRGAGAGDWAKGLAGLECVELEAERFLVRAGDHTLLCDALAAAGRPPEGVRVEVDPVRV